MAMILRWRRAGATALESSRPIGAHQVHSMKRANPLSALSFVQPIVKLALSLSRALVCGRSHAWNTLARRQSVDRSACGDTERLSSWLKKEVALCESEAKHMSMLEVRISCKAPSL